MICKSYNDLSPKERVEFIGRLNHACQSDEEFYLIAQKIIAKAEKKKIFEGVTILPTAPERKEYCREDFINES